jgi:cytochrome c oxidase cbb3-type subunit 2
MSRSFNLFAGLFGSFTVSALALVLAPYTQLGGLQPSFTEEEGKISDVYPIENQGIPAQGRGIYVREGCMYCHTQQVRDPQSGTDLERGWGARRTVARDYLHEEPPLLGSFRVGPDLANAGTKEWRNEPLTDIKKPAKRDAAWHYLHLYSPQVIVKESNHPPYRYLFTTRKISGQRSADAIQFPSRGISQDLLPKEDHEVVPTPAAKALVGYLLSLDRSHALPEAKGAPATPGSTAEADSAAGSAAAAPAAK